MQLGSWRSRVTGLQKKFGNGLAGVERYATGAACCQSCILKQWPEQKKAVITLKDEYDPWPWENAGELILEVCNEKSLL